MRSIRNMTVMTLAMAGMVMILSCSNTKPPDPMAVVEAERAFAAFTAENGMPEGFSQFAADDGVVFAPQAVNAKELYAGREAGTALLTWQPVYAEIASSGDLGWTTGPWEFRRKPTDETATAFGHYNTIWKIQPDGTWKFVIDFGCNHEAHRSRPDSLQTKLIERASESAAVDSEKALKDLEAMERQFSSVCASGGAKHAYGEFAADDLRYYRNGEFPMQGLAPIRGKLEEVTGKFSWVPTLVDVSRAGDLGYAYGVSTLAVGDELTRFSYMHIWRKDPAGQWRLALDIHAPLSSETEADG